MSLPDSRPRTPAGSPEGGQFAAGSAGAEADGAALTSSHDPVQSPRIRGLAVGDRIPNREHNCVATITDLVHDPDGSITVTSAPDAVLAPTSVTDHYRAIDMVPERYSDRNLTPTLLDPDASPIVVEDAIIELAAATGTPEPRGRARWEPGPTQLRKSAYVHDESALSDWATSPIYQVRANVAANPHTHWNDLKALAHDDPDLTVREVASTTLALAESDPAAHH